MSLETAIKQSQRKSYELRTQYKQEAQLSQRNRAQLYRNMVMHKNTKSYTKMSLYKCIYCHYTLQNFHFLSSNNVQLIYNVLLVLCTNCVYILHCFKGITKIIVDVRHCVRRQQYFSSTTTVDSPHMIYCALVRASYAQSENS